MHGLYAVLMTRYCCVGRLAGGYPLQAEISLAGNKREIHFISHQSAQPLESLQRADLGIFLPLLWSTCSLARRRLQRMVGRGGSASVCLKQLPPQPARQWWVNITDGGATRNCAEARFTFLERWREGRGEVLTVFAALALSGEHWLWGLNKAGTF